MTSATTFTHKGIEIKLEANGKFSAQTPTGRVTAASLDAMKRRLDKTDKFESFKAFTLGKWGERKIVDCTVTGVVKAHGRYGIDKFQTDNGALDFVFIDTPENRAAATAYLEMKARHDAIVEQQQKELRAARAEIVSIKPGDKLAA